MEAFIDHLHIRVDQLKSQGAGDLAHSAVYFGENFAISYAQYPLIVGLANSDQITSSSGEKSSVYDAYQWNPNTKEFFLKPGFNEEDVQKMIIKGHDLQTKTQGNFEKLNQPSAMSHLLGRVGFQFHRFFASSWNDRFSKRYTHTTLGEQEGTWRTPLTLIHYVMEQEGYIKDRLNKGWENLTPDQKKNLWFDVVDVLKLMIFAAVAALLTSLAKKQPKDTTSRKMINFLAYTTSRIRFEQQLFIPGVGTLQMAEFLQNPWAISTTCKNFAEAIYETIEFPFQTDDERYYKNGVFVGRSKAAEAWRKSLPILRAYHRWMSMEEPNSYESTLFGNK